MRVAAFPLVRNEILITFETEIFPEFDNGKIKINISEVKKIVPNERLTEALELIEKNYPLSVIEKKKVLDKLNRLSIAFWISDAGGIITLANENLDEFVAVALPTGEKEKEVFFSKAWQSIERLNSLAKETKAIAIHEQIAFENFAGYFFDVIKFPVVNSEGDVVATCGIIQPSTTISIYDKEETPTQFAFENFPVTSAVFDYEGKLIKCTNGFVERLSAADKKILIGKHYSELFSKDLTEELNDFIIDEKRRDAEFMLDIENDAQEKISVRKIFNSKDVFIGSLIIFKEEKKDNCTKILEFEMIDALLNATPDPMFIYDVENLKFLAVNDAAVKFYGYSREQFLEMDLTDLYTPEDIQTLIEFNNDEHSVLEKPVKHKLADGSMAIVQLSRKEIEYEDRKAFITYVRDISKRVESNKNLRELKVLLEISDEILMETDAEGFIVKVNNAVEKVLGYSSDEIKDKTFITLLSENDRAKINKKVFLDKLNEQKEFEITIKNKRGASVPARLVVVPLFDVFEKVEGYALIIKTEKNDGKELSVKAKTRSARIDEEGGASIDVSFLSHLFHEILTPINVIIGFTQELLESLENPTEEQRESAQIISENQRALMQLIDAATEYVALEQNQVRVKPEEFGIVEILDKVEESVSKIARAHDVELKYGKISSSITLKHDKRLVINFVSMFWEFAVRGTKEKQVYLTAKPEGDFVIIAVRDIKNEISENLLRAMNEFLTEDENLVRRNYNVSRFAVRLFRKLSQLLGVEFSEIEKNGAPNAFGAKFLAEYGEQDVTDEPTIKRESPQVEKIPEPEIKRVSETASKRESAFKSQNVRISSSKPKKQAGEKNIELNKLSCLLLEDQVDSQLLFKQQMKELKEIQIFAKFEDALPILRQKKFDFVVMDINLLGDYNGLEALREIKNIPQCRNVPVIASTAYMMPGDQDRYIAAGFDDFIPKPIMRNKLIESLKKVL